MCFVPTQPEPTKLTTEVNKGLHDARIRLSAFLVFAVNDTPSPDGEENL